MARTPSDLAWRPWRHLCLTARHPGAEQSTECRLEYGHPGTHDWQQDETIAADIMAAHGYAFRGLVT